MHVLVTGGAGYIGSHVVRQLSEAGHKVCVIDNLSTGRRENLIHNEEFILCDVGNRERVAAVMAAGHFDAILHFAASIIVPESVADPLKYFFNNTSNTITLLQCAVEAKIPHFIFSSTASVYGMTASGNAVETSILQPVNPYGQSKAMSEKIIQETSRAYGMSYAILRYFNVAGADPLGRMGQSGAFASHLIRVGVQTALGLRPHIEVFGTDYDTKDGTCIRDYIHVEDLAAAHLCALDRLVSDKKSEVYNVGYGQGHTVLEILDALDRVAPHKVKRVHSQRRPGDPPVLIADASKIKVNLGWKPRFNHLETIIQDALNWEKNQPL